MVAIIATVPMQPLERLLNLLTLLLESSSAITFERIRELIPAYQQEDIASAKRMFERDKDLLRDIGVPLEAGATDVWEVEQGYAIPKDRYYVPELTFTAEELAALFVVASGADTADAGAAVQKLFLGAEAALLTRLAGRPQPGAIETEAPHLDATARALFEGRAIRFGYRRATGEEDARTVDPYGLVYRAGSWYVVGHDRDRDAVRAFRLSRVTSAPADAGEGTPPPEGFRAAEHVQTPGEAERGTARVAFAERVAWLALSSVPGARKVGTADTGWVETEVPVASDAAFVGWVAGFGPDARLLEPEALREALIAHLEAVRGAL
jgi:predicted DNA-binding transcriptional regulator YafY